MQSTNVISVRIPGLHDLFPNKGYIYVAGSRSFSVKWCVVFVSHVCNDAATQNNAGSYRNSLLEFSIEGDEEPLVTTKSQSDNARPKFLLAHLVSIFGHTDPFRKM